MNINSLFKEPSRVLKEALRNSLPLKDRLTIKLENDMRYGEVRLDHWLLHAKVNFPYFTIHPTLLWENPKVDLCI